jgi:hypothetical protein
MRWPNGPGSEGRSRADNRCKEGKTKSMATAEPREAKRLLEAGILPLPEEDLTELRHIKVFVEVRGGSGPDRKEIGELSRAEMRTLEPGIRIRVVNRLLERYLAEQGHLDILEERRFIPMT